MAKNNGHFSRYNFQDYTISIYGNNGRFFAMVTNPRGKFFYETETQNSTEEIKEIVENSIKSELISTQVFKTIS